MMPKLFDIHSHVNFPDFDKDRDEVIKRALDKNIWMINVGTDIESSREVIAIAEKYEEGVYAAIGIHPGDLEVKPPSGGLTSAMSALEGLAEHPKVVAIGECGLDFFRNSEARNLPAGRQGPKFEIRNRQEEIFRRQIELSIRIGKPLMIHCRDAHKEVLEILNEYKGKAIGDIHFFSGNIDEAERYLNLGFTLSFTAVITFARQYDEVLEKAPLNKLMVETDAPFVAPSIYRGKRNEPAYVEETAKKMSEIKKESFEKICQETTKNAMELFLKQSL